jgi:mersacidin/lichenicidin family type 2 lantibiotic
MQTQDTAGGSNAKGGLARDMLYYVASQKVPTMARLEDKIQHKRRTEMKAKDIIRAWKDEGYRLSLSEGERAAIPANPAGLVELKDADLGVAAGGRYTPACTLRRTCGDWCGTNIYILC